MTTDLAVIEAALSNLASPLPWAHEPHPMGDWVHDRDFCSLALTDASFTEGSAPTYEPADAHLIANAPAWLAELVERVKAAEWATTVLQCSVSHEDPYDFDYCETHDRTFPIGGKCDHAGISELDYWVDQASMQRGRAVGAEMRAETAEATIARVRELAEQHPGTAWNSGLNLRQALRDSLGGTPTDATEVASSADDERNRFSGEDTDEPTQPILRPTDQRYEPPADDHESGCCRG